MDTFGNCPVEHVFYSRGIDDVLFVLAYGGARYLASCCRLDEEWVVTPISIPELLDLMADRKPIRAVFEKAPAWFVTWDGKEFGMSDQVPKAALPVEGARLGLSGPATKEYEATLRKEVGNA